MRALRPAAGPTVVLAGAVIASCPAAAQQPTVANCTVPANAFHVVGHFASAGSTAAAVGDWDRVQDQPCPRVTRSLAPVGDGRAIFTCLFDGAVLCDGDGSSGADPPSPATCKPLGFLGCGGQAVPHDAQVSPDRRYVFAACGSHVTVCSWDDAAGQASACATVAGAECPGAAERERAIALAGGPGSLTLLLACGQRQVRACPLSPADVSSVSCSTLGYPCSWLEFLNSSMALSNGVLTVTCTDRLSGTWRAVYCEYSPTHGISDCTGVLGSSPCAAGTAGVAVLSSGYTAVGCDSDGYRVCDDISVTVTGTVTERLTLTATATRTEPVLPTITAPLPDWRVSADQCRAARETFLVYGFEDWLPRVVNTTLRNTPCPDAVNALAVKGQWLIAVCNTTSGSGVVVCDGDGTRRGTPTRCHRSLAAGASVLDAAFSNVADAVYFLTREVTHAPTYSRVNVVQRCSWDNSRGIIASCSKIPNVACDEESDSGSIFFLPTAPRSLVLMCTMQAYRCDLLGAGEGSLSGACAPTGPSLCAVDLQSETRYGNDYWHTDVTVRASLDGGHLVVVCDVVRNSRRLLDGRQWAHKTGRRLMYCAFSLEGSSSCGTVATFPDSYTSDGPCAGAGAHKLRSVLVLPSGRVAVGCTGSVSNLTGTPSVINSYSMCSALPGDISITVTETLPSNTPTLTELYSDHPEALVTLEDCVEAQAGAFRLYGVPGTANGTSRGTPCPEVVSRAGVETSIAEAALANGKWRLFTCSDHTVMCDGDGTAPGVPVNCSHVAHQCRFLTTGGDSSAVYAVCQHNVSRVTGCAWDADSGAIGNCVDSGITAPCPTIVDLVYIPTVPNHLVILCSGVPRKYKDYPGAWLGHPGNPVRLGQAVATCPIPSPGGITPQASCRMTDLSQDPCSKSASGGYDKNRLLSTDGEGLFVTCRQNWRWISYVYCFFSLSEGPTACSQTLGRAPWWQLGTVSRLPSGHTVVGALTRQFTPSFRQQSKLFLCGPVIRTVEPTQAPTATPTGAPQAAPTGPPQKAPTESPSAAPSLFPSRPQSGAPSASPSAPPQGRPSAHPSFAPSGFPTRTGFPSTGYPSGYPTGYPRSGFPSGFPSQYPTRAPTGYPEGPSGFPTGFPSRSPTGYPAGPSMFPTGFPSRAPTGYPEGPSAFPTGFPSRAPTTYPEGPSKFPTGFPSRAPTRYPAGPSRFPTGFPSRGPTGYPEGPSQFPTGFPAAV